MDREILSIFIAFVAASQIINGTVEAKGMTLDGIIEILEKEIEQRKNPKLIVLKKKSSDPF